MDLDVNDDQAQLQRIVRRLCSERFPGDVVRSFGRPAGFRRDLWRQLGDVGVFALAAGLGTVKAQATFADAVVAFEELGAGLVPGPLTACGVAAEFVDGVDSGAVVAGLLDRRSRPATVADADALDVFVEIDADGVWQVDASGILAEAVATAGTDPTAALWRIDVPLEARTRVADAADAARLARTGSLLVAAQLVGLSAAATAGAAAYAAERQQFGRPVGSFQALKHILADCWARTEVARAALYAAAAASEDATGDDAGRAVDVARLLAARAASENGAMGVQTYGGMGFTWEVDAHLYVKRAWALDAQFGSADDALDRLADGPYAADRTAWGIGRP